MIKVAWCQNDCKDTEQNYTQIKLCAMEGVQVVGVQ